jgi:hypothetical protein
MKFPENYSLWIQKSGVESDRGNPRIDAYLYGAPHLGPSSSRTQSNSTTFRSPTEFVPHAIWLMRGQTGQCDCKYCIPQCQTVVNRRLNRGLDVESDRESGDDDDDNNGMVRVCHQTLFLIFAPSLPLSAASRRNRGPNAGTGRTRRVRRDRSPPIDVGIARDYRVGVTDPGPSSSTT